MESVITPTQEKPIQPSIFTFEKVGDISPEQEAQVQEVFEQAADSLAEEWQTKEPISVQVVVMSDEKFREGAKENDPAFWKYCFLLRDQHDNRVYINTNIFSVLPDKAEKMIKHELAHIVVGNLVNDPSAYTQSFILEEGTAGLDGATEMLVEKIKKEEITDIPDPLSIDTLEALKALGGDTNLEPFTNQIGYLVLFSFLEFLTKKQGREKIIEIYKKLTDEVSLQEAYREICGEDLIEVSEEWKKFLK